MSDGTQMVIKMQDTVNEKVNEYSRQLNLGRYFKVSYVLKCAAEVSQHRSGRSIT